MSRAPRARRTAARRSGLLHLARPGRVDQQRATDRDQIVMAASLRSELTFTSFGRHGGTTDASTSGLTETQLMKKGQWSSTKATAHYLHHDHKAKQDAQIKRIKRRKQAARK